MTTSELHGPILVCYDGSEGSQSAIRSAIPLLATPANAVTLTVWERFAVRLALAGAFVADASSVEGDIDGQEEQLARDAAEEGARRAREHGFEAEPMVRESIEGIAHTILEVADEISARLIVCGQRGRGPIRTALLGSVSHTLASHTRRPLLIAPELPGR